MILDIHTRPSDTHIVLTTRLAQINRRLNRIIFRIVTNGHGISVQKIAIWSVVRLSLLRS